MLDVEKMSAEIILPSQDAFMKLNSINSSAVAENEENNRKVEEGITAHQMVNNWLANDQNSF